MRSHHRHLVHSTSRRPWAIGPLGSGPAGASPRAGLALLVVLLVVAALLSACSAPATMGATPSSGEAASRAPEPAAVGAVGAKAGPGSDWSHTLQVVANLKADPPTRPVVVLFGGSAARESTISDASWRAKIEAMGGPPTAAYNLGSRNRTLAQNVALVQELPDVPTIVYVGVNLGAFTSAQKAAGITLPKPLTPLPAYSQHAYSQSHILSTAKKRALVRAWLSGRYPVFKRNYATNVGVLEKLLKACRAKNDTHAVLFELPRDTSVIGSRLDAPIARYRRTCQALAKKYGIPYVSFVAQAKLPNSSFYDLWHLVEPGRVKWQKLLSAKTAALLEKYGYGDGSGS